MGISGWLCSILMAAFVTGVTGRESVDCATVNTTGTAKLWARRENLGSSDGYGAILTDGHGGLRRI